MTRTRVGFVALFAALISPTAVLAQQNPNLETGIKPFGSYDSTQVDSVDLSNGNLIVHIPLFNYPQRGSLTRNMYALWANGKNFYVYQNCNRLTGVCQDSWKWQGPPDTGQVVFPADMENIGVTWRFISPAYVFTATSADGSTHQMGSISGRAGYESVDGTGIFYGGWPNNTSDARIIKRNGDYLGEDSNGNIAQSTDTLGRTIPGATNATSDYSGCAGPLPIVSASITNYPAPNGGSAQVKACFATVTISTNFQAIDPQSNPIAELHTTESLVQSIAIFDGSSWGSSPTYTLEYNTYADITKITLPTNGTISYLWSASTVCNSNALIPMSRILLQRTLDAQDGTGPQTTRYMGLGGLGTTTVDPNGNETLHYMTGIAGSCSLYETETQYYQGSHTTGTLLKTIQTDYSGQLNPFDTYGDGTTTAIDVHPIRITTTWPTGQVSKVEHDYDSSLTFYSFGAHTISLAGNPLETREYDYGQGAAGSLLRRTDYSYLAFANSNYLNANFVDLLSSSTVYDGGGTQVASTSYGYDEYTLASSGISTQRDTSVPNPGIRGNRTSTHRWLNTTGGTLTSTSTYYDTGMPYQVTDAGGHTTTYSYSSSFAGAYVTQTQMPDTGSPAVHHITSGNYDFNSGLLSSFTGQNGEVSSYNYDGLFRMISAVFPNTDSGGTHGETDFIYPNLTTVETKQRQDASTWIDHYSYFDGLGRVRYTLLNSDPEGAVRTDTSYDALGRVYCVSNPYRGASTDGSTCTSYDAIGRPTAVVEQDNSVVGTAYSGNSVTLTDEAGQQRRSYSDALGRLIQVDEPGPAGTPAVVAGGSVTISGSEQATTSGGSAGSGSVTINGSEQSFVIDCPRAPCPREYDTGTVSVTVSSMTKTVTYGHGWTSTSVAGGLANAFNGDGSSPVAASSSNNILTLTAKTGGASTNYALSATSQSTNPDFSGASFSTSPSGSTLTGGADGGTVYDSGSSSITVNGHTDSASWGQGSTSSSVASALVTSINNDGSAVVTASLSGSTVTLTAKTAGAAANSYSLSISSSTNQGAYFGSPSFSGSTSGATLSGGVDAAPGGLGSPYTTIYAYDALDNLNCAEQHGGVSGTGCSSDPSLDAGSAWRVRRFTYDSFSRLLSAKNPESGTVQYAYTSDPTCNPDGLLLSSTDARSFTTSYCYDALHRTTRKSYSDGSSAREFYYDQSSHGYSIGLMTHASNDVNAAYDPSYDAMGKITSQSYCIPSDCSYGVSVSAQYDAAGHLTWLTYPDGRKVQNSYSAAGRLTKVNYDSFAGTAVNSPFFTVAQGSTSSTWGYSPAGSPLRGTYGNGVMESLGYNNRMQLNSIVQATGAQTLFSKSYNYADSSRGNADNGNVVGITDNLSSTRNQSFAYDQLNRIVAGSQSDGAFNQTFSYDPWGNLRQSGTWSFQQNFSGNNQVSGYSYDGTGDLLNDGVHNYAYDAEGRIKTVDGTSATYTYGPDGERVRKDAGGGFIEYIYFAGEPIAEKTGSGWTDYVFANGRRIAMSNSSAASATQYYHADHLGTARMMTDSAGNTISNCLYAPFGQQVSCSPDNPGNHYKFTGKERDTESGLDFFGARFYSSTMGRWMSPDWSSSPEPVPYADLDDPQTLNLYGYVRNNPMSKGDKDGHCADVLTCTLTFVAVGGGSTILAGAAAVSAGIAAIVTSVTSSYYPGGGGGGNMGSIGMTNSMLDAQRGVAQEQTMRSGEQGRDAQGKFLPKQAGEAQPGSGAEKRGLEALGMDKNTKPIPGSNRIPDGKTPAGDQYGEIKSGSSISNTDQLKEMGKAAVDATGKPLVVGTTNPNAKVSGPAQNNPNLQIRPLKQQ